MQSTSSQKRVSAVAVTKCHESICRWLCLRAYRQQTLSLQRGLHSGYRGREGGKHQMTLHRLKWHFTEWSCSIFKHTFLFLSLCLEQHTQFGIFVNGRSDSLRLLSQCPYLHLLFRFHHVIVLLLMLFFVVVAANFSIICSINTFCIFFSCNQCRFFGQKD